MTKQNARATLAAVTVLAVLSLLGSYGAGFPLEQPGPLALAALVGAAVGVPLGVLAHRHPRSRR